MTSHIVGKRESPLENYQVTAGRRDSRYQCWKGKLRPVIAGIGATYHVTEWNGMIHLVFVKNESLVQSLREREDSPRHSWKRTSHLNLYKRGDLRMFGAEEPL